MAENPTITVERTTVRLDPSLNVFQVTLEKKDPAGTWSHSTGSEAELAAFLEGVKAGVSMMGGYISLPEIPTHSMKTWSEVEADNSPG